MQKKILGTVFAILFLGVSFLLYKLLHQDIELQTESAEYLTPTKQPITQEAKQKPWIQEMAHKDSREFSFPVNELFMQIDLYGPDGTKQKAFKLLIDRADRYSLFCLVQTLSALQLSFVVIKENKIPIVYVKDKNIKRLETAVQALEKYDIKSKITEI